MGHYKPDAFLNLFGLSLYESNGENIALIIGSIWFIFLIIFPQIMKHFFFFFFFLRLFIYLFLERREGK